MVTYGRMVIRHCMVIHMVSQGVGGGGTLTSHMVKINHMVKICKISSKNQKSLSESTPPGKDLISPLLKLCPAASFEIKSLPGIDFFQPRM
jgi:hypothetical protein